MKGLRTGRFLTRAVRVGPDWIAERGIHVLGSDRMDLSSGGSSY